jgi:peptidyl-prolyl cis-trans isomerase SurA
MQEAKRRNVSVSDKEIEDAIANVERQNNMPPGGLDQFLRAHGLSHDTMEQQIRAAIAWGKVVSQLYRGRLTVGNDEIEEMLERLRERQGQPEYRLAEIVLTVDTPQREQATADAAARLVAEIKNGARFEVMARQFSQSATAAAGGDLGWVVSQDLNEQLRSVVDRLQPDEVAGPFRTQIGYQIVKLLGRRGGGAGASPSPSAPVRAATPVSTASAPAKAAAVQLKLRQVFFTPGGPGGSAIERARAAAAKIKDCADMERAAREAKSPMPVDLGTVKTADLSVQVRNAVADLPVGKPSQPVAVGDGAIVLMVCGREGSSATAPAPAPAAANANEGGGAPPAATAGSAASGPTRMPTREEISSLLMRQRLDLAARRHLRDIRLAAVIDTRL